MSKHARILIFEGSNCTGLSRILQQNGWYVRITSCPKQMINDGSEAELLIFDTYDLNMVLSIYQQLDQHVKIPMILITPDADENLVLSPLRSPLSYNELHTLINTLVVNRSAETIILHDLVIDLKRRHVTRDGKDVALSPTEYQLFAYLAQRKGEAVTFEELLIKVWFYERGLGDRKLVINTVQRLRRKLFDKRKRVNYIISIRGVGYRIFDQL